jgi:RimJ/RimL family protein N-acetyltransferase
MTEGMPPARPRIELTDGLVRLRAHTSADIDRIVEQSNDPESMQWTTVPRPYGPDEAREFLAHIEAGWADPKGHRSWAIEEVAAPGVYLGTIDLRPRGLSAEVGFGLHPQGRGRGVMSGALRLVCRYWFSTGGQQVTWWANRGNWASWRVAWACGFTHRGTLPGYLTDEHGAVDAWVATLLAEDPMDPLTPWSEPPVIESATDGLRLRPWRDQDVDTMEDRDQPAHFMPARGILDQATFPEWLLVRRERLSWGKTLSWAIADLASDRALGEVLLFVHEGTLDDDTAELGYQVVPSARGRGVASAATRLAVAHAFAPREAGGLGLRRLVAQTAQDNAASNGVLTQAGFTVWGRESAADLLPNGRGNDALHWELLS